MIDGLIAFVLAMPIGWRILQLTAELSPARFTAQHGAMRWHGFALSYVVLGGAAAFAVLEAFHHGLSLPLLLFLVASDGLIFFDPRRKP